jgi:hypothetical protein
MFDLLSESPITLAQASRLLPPGRGGKHSQPEDLLYAVLTLHRKDASNAFKAALQAFGVTWERKSKGVEKVAA